MSSFSPRGGVAVENGRVGVWTVRLEASEPCFERARALLSTDEAARASRLHFDRHRKAFVLGRAALRVLLGELLGQAPQDIQFLYGPKGKPELAGSSSWLCFNASNSGDLAAYAFTRGCPVGIDIEHSRLIPEIQDIARRFFAADEVAELMNLPEAERLNGFYRCWTRKEAYIKAVGDGLSLPLDSFRVSLRPDEPARMLHLGGNTDAAEGWSMHAFTPAPDYFGAVVYPDHARPIEFHPLLPVQELLESL
jgi:4'-phosphopantetheinyl transferase